MRRFLFMKRKTEIPENGLISSIYLKCMTFFPCIHKTRRYKNP